jgi:hypothetical protein
LNVNVLPLLKLIEHVLLFGFEFDTMPAPIEPTGEAEMPVDQMALPGTPDATMPGFEPI